MSKLVLSRSEKKKKKSKSKDHWLFLKYSNEAIQNGGEASDGEELSLILGLDGGTTSTICICIPFSDQLADPVRVLSRAAAGCSNHNSVGAYCSNLSEGITYYILYALIYRSLTSLRNGFMMLWQRA